MLHYFQNNIYLIMMIGLFKYFWLIFLVHVTISDKEITIKSRIAGGEDALITDHPHLVYISLQKVGKKNRAQCTGSIIKPNWVLTAAHCLVDTVPESVFVKYGTSDRRKGPEVKAEVLIPHEKYNSEMIENDVGLIKLPEGHVQFNATVNQIALPRDADDEFDADQPVTICGWGLNELRKPQSILQCASVPTLSSTKCAIHYKAVVMNDSVFCAGDIRRKGMKGDSGGPLVQNKVLYGINFQGHGNLSIPTVYEKVSKYLDWIESHTNERK